MRISHLEWGCIPTTNKPVPAEKLALSFFCAIFLLMNNRPIKVDPHGLSGADNSYYKVGGPNYPPGFGYVAFGEGGVDDAEDADVILHEYGHALQDNVTPGKYGSCSTEAGAMGEGFGDYRAASNNNTTFDPACIGEWDSVPGCLRRVDTKKHYPENTINECHADGEIWSGALWDMFNSIGKFKTDSLVLWSHDIIGKNTSIENPTFCDGAKAIIKADEQIYASANKTAIIDIMEKRACYITERKGKLMFCETSDNKCGQLRFFHMLFDRVPHLFRKAMSPFKCAILFL
ncbi:MAG: M36 family metallopeptidase [Nitrospirae bacterium]|nr:M36 family metallopeptidase [Nitrospirota bacterium]